MQKITISDFSGGIQESTVPDDFTERQWAQLKGIIPSSQMNFESQWPMQTVGSAMTDAIAVYPLEASTGTFLVAIDSSGQVWWCKPAATSATYSTSGATSWTRITAAQNKDYAGNSISVLSNTDYKFVCNVPFQVYKYVRTPDAGDADNSSKDVPVAGQLVQATAVLIHSTTVNGSADTAPQQALVAYVDTTNAVVKVVTFPNLRRTPMHNTVSGDYIKALVGSTYEEFPTWLTGTSPYRAFHPYTYLDIDLTVLPGVGIMPRSNVGVAKGNLLLLGDIEWESTNATRVDPESEGYIADSSGGTSFSNIASSPVNWPSNVLNTSRVIYVEGPGNIYLKDDNNMYALISNKAADGTYATLTTTATHGYSAGDKVQITSVDDNFNGTFTVYDAPTSTSFRYTLAKTVTSTAVASPYGKAIAYEYKYLFSEYNALPNSFPNAFYAMADAPGTKIKWVSNVNTARALLNDTNTGPHRSGMYYSSSSDIDIFDPRSVLIFGKSDVTIVGMHTIGDTVVVVTTAGSTSDGVFRLSGYLSRLISYTSTVEDDSDAARIELVRGGVGPAQRTSTRYRPATTLWSDAGVVVFVDKLGGVWYTNGKVCDRLDRVGPKQPVSSTDSDHVAHLGQSLFVYRDSRLLCFTLMTSSAEAGTADGCWTEVNIPAAISSMTGGTDQLFFIMGGKVVRMVPAGPNSERACYDNTPLTITVSTLTAGDITSHRRTNWHQFGMTFATPTSCTVGTVRVQSTGALNVSGTAAFPDVQYLTTLNRTYSDKGVLGEFIVNSGIGPQAMCSVTVTFTGYVQLQTASFWVSGNTPRIGDK